MDAARIARIAVFAALIAAMGTTPAFSVSGVSAPITLQSTGVMLAGLMLVPVEAFQSMALFVGLVAAGLPLLSGGRGGAALFQTVSAGFLIGFPIAAAVVSLIAMALRGRPGRSMPVPAAFAVNLAAAALGGVVALYAVAVPVSSWVTGADMGSLISAFKVFVPGDLLKAVAAAAVVVAVFRAAPFLRPGASRTAAPARTDGVTH